MIVGISQVDPPQIEAQISHAGKRVVAKLMPCYKIFNF